MSALSLSFPVGSPTFSTDTKTTQENKNTPAKVAEARIHRHRESNHTDALKTIYVTSFISDGITFSRKPDPLRK